MPVPAFLRSAGIRFAIVFAMLLTAGAAGISLWLWWATAGLLDRQTEAAITTDAVSLSDRWSRGGLSSLATTIEDRLAQNVDDDALYLLVDPLGRRVAGNLERWPVTVNQPGQYFEIQLRRGGVRLMAMVKRYDLAGGFLLLIGRDIEPRIKLRALLTDALLSALAIAAVIAILGALVVRKMFMDSIANVSATASAIASGDLARRVKLTGRGDELDQLAEVINDMLDRIGRLMEGVKQVSDNIAHDLRTPIARARARLEDAAIHAETQGDLNDAIDRAINDLDGVVSIFQALLRISEIEAGSRRASFARFDAAPLVRNMIDLYEAVAEEKGVRLIAAVPPSAAMRGDAAMVQQAVANLLDNAVKFAPEGTRVSLSLTTNSTMVEITVADEGAGIPEEELAKVTERFYRGETARSSPGSGLGLTLVSAVAQLHGGSLKLRNVHPGLRASLTLPVAPSTARLES